MLEAEAKLGNADAIFTLAELNFFSYYGYPRNLTLAFDYYSKLASEKGNATAQRMVGFMFATGIGNVVERDQGKALLYSTFAASGGDYEAQMMVGFRYLMGIGTSRNCEKAVEQYKKVADKAMEHYHSGPSNRRVPPSPKMRLPDEHGGIYGYAHNGGSVHRDPSDVEDILQYTRELAESGDIQAQINLAHIYYRGGHHIERNYQEAFKYYSSVAEQKFYKNQVRDVSDAEANRLIAQACGMMGEMYRRGEGVVQDDKAAYKWYQRGVRLESPIANNGLGDMYLKGIVVAKNVEEARRYFEVASSMDYPEAHVNLGLLHLKAPVPDYEKAYALFFKAYEGHHIPAYYHLAELIHKGHVEQPCSTVVTLYKNFVERMDWLHSPFPDAHRAYKKGDIETAFLRYLIGAEMGYEIGQTNVAWLLDHDRFEIMEQSPDLIPKDLPLIYWARSANQGQSNSKVKMGDYYYYGIGTEVDLKKAALCYEKAAKHDLNELGMWNLGWMYENGLGVPKDFHLAKRMYDSSLIENAEAYLPVTLSLIKLSAKYTWSYLLGEDVGDGFFFTSPPRLEEDTQRAPLNPLDEPEKELDRIAEGEDYHQRARKKREDDEDYAEQQESSEEEGDFIEDLVILALCLLVGWMVYVRQFRAAGPNPQPLPPQMDPRWRWGPLA
ncbi:HCP-like protein [Basidiobolus meristosporus CBS 931.73]|uniref:HCP-like protein n=1 Tax=Basidiobolus meristosporus CBS 931.73 TaxID=1314790 RepID=A0A1Y1Y113_9FUNG|nr:HCP-like protein [Basidiobolus meristosporus CBS 931.73]|eukprot:ORX91693.1 HCP-like protein [Basidiobolus meristosporus CBS 931.73]